MNVNPIGTIRTPFREPKGAPVQPVAAGGAEGVVELDPRYAEGLRDLEGFERVWLLYWFHQAAPARMTVRPFLDDTDRGLFATRAPCRPNPIGLSCVRLLRVEGNRLHVADVDMLDGTPLLDIKPYAPQFDHYEVSRVGWLAGKDPAGRAADGRFQKKE